MRIPSQPYRCCLRAAAIALALGAAACPAGDAASSYVTAGATTTAEATPTAAATEDPMALSWQSTDALVEDPRLRAAVDHLATFPEIQSARTGEGGTPSEAYAAFEAVIALAGLPEQLALLRHEVPVVRGYLLAHIAPVHPVPEDVLRALLHDETPVAGRNECILGSASIASRTVEALCAAAPAAAHAAPALEFAVRWARPDALGARAVACLARRDAARAIALAIPLLEHADSVVRRQAVHALIAAEDSAQVGRVAPLSADPDPLVRATVATALGRLGHDREALLPLIRDEAPYVRQLAGMALVELEGVDATLLAPLLADPAARVRSGVAQAMARHGVELPLLEPMLLEAGVDGQIMRELSQREEPALAPAMRRLSEAQTAYVRERALDWLGRHGDASDLPLLRAGLAGPSVGERRVAAAALARRGDREAVPLLLALLAGDDNPHGRIAAAGALLTLDEAAHREAVERAATAEPAPWARTLLRELLDGPTPSAD